MKTRKLKIYYGAAPPLYRMYPVIRLAGKYLLNQGFKIGDEIGVTFEENRIVITKVQAGKQPPKFQLEIFEDVETGQREVTLIPMS